MKSLENMLSDTQGKYLGIKRIFEANFVIVCKNLHENRNSMAQGSQAPTQNSWKVA